MSGGGDEREDEGQRGREERGKRKKTNLVAEEVDVGETLGGNVIQGVGLVPACVKQERIVSEKLRRGGGSEGEGRTVGELEGGASERGERVSREGRSASRGERTTSNEICPPIE